MLFWKSGNFERLLRDSSKSTSSSLCTRSRLPRGVHPWGRFQAEQEAHKLFFCPQLHSYVEARGAEQGGRWTVRKESREAASWLWHPPGAGRGGERSSAWDGAGGGTASGTGGPPASCSWAGMALGCSFLNDN